MRTRAFTDRTQPVAGPIYCDTSFILDFFAHSRPGVSISNPMVRDRAKTVVEFFIWARMQEVLFYTSLLAVEECYHRVLFTPLRRAAGKGDWKTLRANNPAEFSTALAKGRLALRTFQGFLASSGIRLVTLGAKNPAGVQRLVGYARALLLKHEVDAMDAFQYAVMRRHRLPSAASCDVDWANLPFGILVTMQRHRL